MCLYSVRIVIYYTCTQLLIAFAALNTRTVERLILESIISLRSDHHHTSAGHWSFAKLEFANLSSITSIQTEPQQMLVKTSS